MADRFDELTEPELLTLSDDSEAVQRWIDLECAYEGVPLLPPKPEAPIEPKMTPDQTVYEVHGIFFSKNEHAIRVANEINDSQRVELQYVSGPRYDRLVKPAPDRVAVTPINAFSPATWETVKDAANAYTTLKTKYDSAWLDYSTAERERKAIVERIKGAIEEAWGKERRREMMRRNLARYMELAGGVRKTAIRFLKAAYPNAAEILPEIDVPEIAEDQPARAYRPS